MPTPDRWWERHGRHNPDNRLELERFYFDRRVLDRIAGRIAQQLAVHLDALEADWQRIRTSNDAFFAQQEHA